MAAKTRRLSFFERLIELSDCTPGRKKMVDVANCQRTLITESTAYETGYLHPFSASIFFTSLRHGRMFAQLNEPLKERGNGAAFDVVCDHVKIVSECVYLESA